MILKGKPISDPVQSRKQGLLHCMYSVIAWKLLIDGREKSHQARIKTCALQPAVLLTFPGQHLVEPLPFHASNGQGLRRMIINRTWLDGLLFETW